MDRIGWYHTYVASISIGPNRSSKSAHIRDQSYDAEMPDTRVIFDFDISFSNGGGLQGQDFRLDIDGQTVGDQALAALVVEDLRLLMVNEVTISNKRYTDEPHKRE